MLGSLVSFQFLFNTQTSLDHTATSHKSLAFSFRLSVSRVIIIMVTVPLPAEGNRGHIVMTPELPKLTVRDWETIEELDVSINF